MEHIVNPETLAQLVQLADAVQINGTIFDVSPDDTEEGTYLCKNVIADQRYVITLDDLLNAKISDDGYRFELPDETEIALMVFNPQPLQIVGNPLECCPA